MVQDFKQGVCKYKLIQSVEVLWPELHATSRVGWSRCQQTNVANYCVPIVLAYNTAHFCHKNNAKMPCIKTNWRSVVPFGATDFYNNQGVSYGGEALGFKVNDSKAWSVGIKRNKKRLYIYGVKNRFAPCRGCPNNSNSPEFKVFPAVEGWDSAQNLRYYDATAQIRPQRCKFKFQIWIFNRMSNEQNNHHMRYVWTLWRSWTSAVNATPSWALVFSERQLKFGVKHNKQESNNVSLSLSRLRQALWNSSRNSKSLAQLKRTFWRMSEAHCYRLVYHWNPPAKHSTQWWS